MLRRSFWNNEKTRLADGLARDFGATPKMMSDLLDRTVARLAAQGDKVDPQRFVAEVREDITKSIGQLSAEVTKIQAHLDQMDESSKHIFNLHQDGHKHKDIAQLMSTDVLTVRKVLTEIYVDLRMLMFEPGEDLQAQAD